MSRAVSPELVLVDPALARVERQRLVEQGRLAELSSEYREPALAPSPGTADVEAPSRGRKALVAGVAAVSLAANFVLAFIILGEHVDRGAQQRTRARGLSSNAEILTVAQRPREVRLPAIPASASAAERHVLLWIYRMPSAALPEPLASAGRNGLSAVRVSCHRRARPTSYGCTVWFGGKRLRQALAVRYPAAAEGGALVRWTG